MNPKHIVNKHVLNIIIVDDARNLQTNTKYV